MTIPTNGAEISDAFGESSTQAMTNRPAATSQIICATVHNKLEQQIAARATSLVLIVIKAAAEIVSRLADELSRRVISSASINSA